VRHRLAVLLTIGAVLSGSIAATAGVLLRETVLADGTRMNPEMRANPGGGAN